MKPDVRQLEAGRNFQHCPVYPCNCTRCAGEDSPYWRAECEESEDEGLPCVFCRRFGSGCRCP